MAGVMMMMMTMMIIRYYMPVDIQSIKMKKDVMAAYRVVSSLKCCEYNTTVCQITSYTLYLNHNGCLLLTCYIISLY